MENITHRMKLICNQCYTMFTNINNNIYTHTHTHTDNNNNNTNNNTNNNVKYYSIDNFRDYLNNIVVLS